MSRYTRYTRCKACPKYTGGGDFCSLDCYGEYRKDPDKFKEPELVMPRRSLASPDLLPYVSQQRGVLTQEEAREYEAEYLRSLQRFRTNNSHGPHGGQGFEIKGPHIVRVGAGGEQLSLLSNGHIVDRRAL